MILLMAGTTLEMEVEKESISGIDSRSQIPISYFANNFCFGYAGNHLVRNPLDEAHTEKKASEESGRCATKQAKAMSPTTELRTFIAMAVLSPICFSMVVILDNSDMNYDPDRTAEHRTNRMVTSQLRARDIRPSGVKEEIEDAGTPVTEGVGAVSEVVRAVVDLVGSVAVVIGSISDVDGAVSDVVGAVAGVISVVVDVVGSISDVVGAVSDVIGSVVDVGAVVDVVGAVSDVIGSVVDVRAVVDVVGAISDVIRSVVDVVRAIADVVGTVSDDIGSVVDVRLVVDVVGADADVGSISDVVGAVSDVVGAIVDVVGAVNVVAVVVVGFFVFDGVLVGKPVTRRGNLLSEDFRGLTNTIGLFPKNAPEDSSKQAKRKSPVAESKAFSRAIVPLCVRNEDVPVHLYIPRKASNEEAIRRSSPPLRKILFAA
ncbi:hypothetical protein AAG570_009604 [Ranatra chinensis]|uniref:Uncharacterized protein n=1 Tax=Ranatra chinensis TaxID=642074 RepID=A0ABD0ZCU7_9HEMI